jgi:hypothetical protein
MGNKITPLHVGIENPATQMYKFHLNSSEIPNVQGINPIVNVNALLFLKLCSLSGTEDDVKATVTYSVS